MDPPPPSSCGGSMNATNSKTNGPNISILSQFMNSSFSDLLSQPENEDFGSNWGFELQNSKPKSSFHHYPIPSSPAQLSPSSFISSFDSPIQANILPSSTNGDFNAQTLMEDYENYSSFSFPVQIRNSMEESLKTQQNERNSKLPAEETNYSSMTTIAKPELGVVERYTPQLSAIQNIMHNNYTAQPASTQSSKNQSKSDDGYNWRKYGQKQVKGTENPRSYFKCTVPNCPTKKKVETTLDGNISEIVYKGNHSHPKPQSTKRFSSQSYHKPPSTNSDMSIQQHDDDYMENLTAAEILSASLGHEYIIEQGETSKPGEDNASDPEAKRWKGEYENKAITAHGNQTVREARIVVQTTSDIDILDDGYRWRKYGQKVVKGNPNPRSYYKYTYVGCPVRKHVERASHDLRAVITTYEGKHNHDVPAPRGSGDSYHINRTSCVDGAAGVFTTVQPITNYTSSLEKTRLPLANGQAAFSLEMLQGQGRYDLSGFVNSTYSYINQTEANK